LLISCSKFATDSLLVSHVHSNYLILMFQYYFCKKYDNQLLTDVKLVQSFLSRNQLMKKNAANKSNDS